MEDNTKILSDKVSLNTDITKEGLNIYITKEDNAESMCLAQKITDLSQKHPTLICSQDYIEMVLDGII
jgi:hypothetical protein